MAMACAGGRLGRTGHSAPSRAHRDLSGEEARITVRAPYSVFYDIAEGKITALRAYFPILALVQQLQP
jgi:ketosteroid isomerase-like protein